MKGWYHMELKYSVKGVPYIEVDEYNKFIFSSTTRGDDGYKWIVFSGASTITTSVSAGKGTKKKRKEITSTNPVSAMIDMEFSNITKYSKLNNPYLTKKYLQGIKDILQPFTKDGVLLDKNMNKLKQSLLKGESVNPEDLMNEDPMGYYEEDDEEENEE
jgi:hypothetical protein